MFGETYEVLHENNGRVTNDYADIFHSFDPETDEEHIEASIYYDIDYLDNSDASTKLVEKYGECLVSDEERTAFLNNVNIHSSRYGGIQADDVYLNANKATVETIIGLLKRGTTTIYEDNKCRYYLQGIEFFHEDGDYYVSGLLSIEDSYNEKIFNWPNTHVIQENVKYKVADGASVFSVCGAYVLPIEEQFGDTRTSMGNGFVLVEDEKLYGLLFIDAE